MNSTVRRAVTRRFFIRVKHSLQHVSLFTVSILLVLAGETTVLTPITKAAGIGSAWWDGSPQVTQNYGCTTTQELNGAPYGCPKYWHSGIDVGLGCGENLYSPVDGAMVVATSGPMDSNGSDDHSFASGFGPYYPTILLPDGNLVLLGHTNPVSVPLNTPLAKGTVITTVGGHGYVIPIGSCHVHFEVRPKGTPYNAGAINPATGLAYAYAIDPYTELNPVVNPGGWWNTPPTLNNGDLIAYGSTITLSAHAQDNHNQGLSRVNITVKDPATGVWGIINPTTATSVQGMSQADVSANYTVPFGTTRLYASFDVYSSDGRYQLAPNGEREFCSAAIWPCDTSDVTGGQGSIGGATCSTAPTTSSQVTGSVPGAHGWWRSPVTVSLSANAPCGQSGLQTFYRINSGDRQTYSSPIQFNQEGVYDLSFYSVDGFGNIENTNTTVISIDWTPPVTVGTATGPRDTNGIFRDSVAIGLNATDNLSGVDYQQTSSDGGNTWTTLNGNNNTFNLTGNGVWRFLYRSVDIAGNVEGAKDSGPIIINKYVMFGNSTGQSVQFLGTTGLTLSGDVFSNGTAIAQGNTGSTLGTTLTTVGTSSVFDSSNTNTTMPTATTGVSPVPMLSYPLGLYQSIATVVFPSDLMMDSVNSTLNSIIYVNGNVEMDDVDLSGPVSIIATGNIVDDTTASTFQTNDPHNGVLIYAGQNITVNSTGNTNVGLLYAPNGTVSINGNGLNLNGSLVGNTVQFNGTTNSTISYSPAFANGTYSLPLAAMGLVAPATTTVSIPSVPSTDGPTGTITSTNPVLTWEPSTGAVGYQMQLSTSSAFSTLLSNLSQFSTGRRVSNLQSGTTYYWRVRAINQAGMSGWSNVTTFNVTTPPPPPPAPITNGGFETGDFTGWTRSGTTSISSTAHSGKYSAMLGATMPTNGDGTATQTFTAPSGSSTVSFYYKVVCKGTVFNDWATATLKDNTSGSTQTVLSKTCSNNNIWWNSFAIVSAGHTYTLTLDNHDDNSAITPTYTLFDDVVVK